MSSEHILTATRRTLTGKKVKAMRREGKLPAIVFGKHIGSIPITLDSRDATLVLRKLPSSALINLNVDGDSHTVLVRDKQFHVLKGHLMHLDFQAVSMTEKIVSMVPVRLHGTAPVLSEYESMLISDLEELEVEAFPGDLPEYIDVDVSSIKEIGDAVTVASLSLGDKIDVRHEDNENIVIAISIAAPEEEEEEEIEVGEFEPELIARGKAEEEEEEREEE
jgi:large subunit ribosomal protein L25